MAALVKFTRLAKFTNKTSLGAVVSVRNHWNKDFKPAPFPESQKERDAAAKKYNISKEEYQPYPGKQKYFTSLQIQREGKSKDLTALL